MRYKITLSYSGADFCGWQRQPGAPSVQETLENALETLLGKPVKVTGAGRTDTSVSAVNYVAHFDASKKLDASQVCCKLNAILPSSITVSEVAPAAKDFHARFGARNRTYTYFLHRSKDPFLQNISYLFTYPEVDFELMNKAAALLVGTHDFAAFSANPHRDIGGTVRTVFGISVARAGRVVTIEVTGNGFLYKMVRSIAGHLMRVGRHAVDAAETAAILESRTRTARVETAPACGLTLWRIWYSPRSGYPEPRHP